MNTYLRLISLCLFLSACALFSPKPNAENCSEQRGVASANMCANLFGVNSNYTVVDATISEHNSEIANNRKLINELEAEISKPESHRTEKDPRWFARWKDASKNPITIRLKEQTAELKERNQKLEKNLTRLKEVREKTTALESQLAQVHDKIKKLTALKIVSESQLDKNIKKWATKTYRALEDQLQYNTRTTNEKLKTENLENLEQSILEFSTTLTEIKEGKITNQTFTTIHNFFETRSATIAGNLGSKILGRNLQKGVENSLVSVAAHTGTSLKRTIETFKAIDDIGEAKRDGIYDIYVAMLTHTSLTHNKSATEVTDLFLKIDRLGQTTKDKFSIEDAEVAALTELAVSTNTPADNVIKTFFELESLARNYKGEYDFTHATDQALVYLTDYAIRNKVSDLQGVINKVFKAFELSNTVKEKFYINDLGISILQVTSHKSKLTLEAVNKKFFELLEKLNGDNPIHDEAVAHYAEIMILFDVPATEFVAVKTKVDQLLPMSSVAAKKGVLARAYTRARANKHSEPTDSDLQIEASAARLSREKMVDWLVDATSQKKHGSSLDVGTPVVSSNYSSAEPYTPPFQMSYNSDGIHSNINFNSTLGMDLSDGSLTINVGGIRFDTDGSGPSFNF